MVEFVEKVTLTLKFGAAYRPLSNRANEQSYGTYDVVVKKAMEGIKSLSLQEALNIAS